MDFVLINYKLDAQSKNIQLNGDAVLFEMDLTVKSDAAAGAFACLRDPCAGTAQAQSAGRGAGRSAAFAGRGLHRRKLYRKYHHRTACVDLPNECIALFSVF